MYWLNSAKSHASRELRPHVVAFSRINSFLRAIQYPQEPSRNTHNMVSSWATTGSMQTGRRATAVLKPSSLAVLGTLGVMQLWSRTEKLFSLEWAAWKQILTSILAETEVTHWQISRYAHLVMLYSQCLE